MGRSRWSVCSALSPEQRRRRRERANSGEGGETLIEVLMTVVLLGTAIVALVSLMLTLVVSSNSHRRRVRAANEAVTIVEELERVSYVPCATPTEPSYVAAMEAAFQIGPDVSSDDPMQVGYQPRIAQIRHLGDRSAPAPDFDDDCPPAGDQGVQEITIELRSPRQTEVTESVVLVKRDDRNDCVMDPCS